MQRLLIIIFTLFATLAAHAAQVVVVPPPHAREGGKFVVTIRVVNGEVSGNPAPPQLQGCTLIFGPSRSFSQSVQFVNGQRSSSSSTEFSYTYRADKKGTVTIPAMTLNVDGKDMKTKPVQFLIDEAGQQQDPTRTNRPVRVDDISTQSSDRRVEANDVFVRIILNKSTAYEQEAIECTIKLYTKYGIREFMPTKQPAFDGFLIQEVDLRPTLNQRETYNGQEYMTAVLKKCIIFPQKSGKLTINSGEYDISVVQYDQTNMYYFTVSTPTERKIKVNSNSASIDIKALPQPAPDGFSGAVGTFSVDSRLIGNRFSTGEAASLIYTIKGTGNIKYVKEPEIDFPAEFELYTPKSDFEGGVHGANVTGTMTIDYTFVPKSVGQFKIPADNFVYFDPATHSYVTLTTEAFTVNVAKGTDDERTEITTKNTDILHIHPGAVASAEDHLAVSAWWYWALYIVLTLALLIVLYLYGRNLRLAADVAGSRLARADKVARRRLKAARALLDKGDAEAFHTEMVNALWGFLSDKLSIPRSRLLRDNVQDELARYGAPEDLAHRTIEILDRAETARYTPDASAETDRQLLDDAAATIGALEKLRRK